METKRKTEEVITALQNMPSLGEELVRETRRTKSFYDIARRTIKAIKEPTENRRGSEQLEHSANKGTLIFKVIYLSIFRKLIFWRENSNCHNFVLRQKFL